MHGELGMTILVVAHDLNPLLTLLDSAIYLLNAHAYHAPIAEVVDDVLLTDLYGTPMQVTHTRHGELYMRSAL